MQMFKQLTKEDKKRYVLKSFNKTDSQVYRCSQIDRDKRSYAVKRLEVLLIVNN